MTGHDSAVSSARLRSEAICDDVRLTHAISYLELGRIIKQPSERAGHSRGDGIGARRVRSKPHAASAISPMPTEWNAAVSSNVKYCNQPFK